MEFEERDTFKREFTIEGFKCDMNNRMKLSSILKDMQEIGNLHLASLGFSKAVMAANNWAFLLSKIYIKIHRTPKENEKVIQQTAPKKTKGIYFFRDINFYDENGTKLIEAHTVWVLVSTENNRHKVLRPKVFNMPCECKDNTDYTVSSWKADIPDCEYDDGVREIRFSDIDCNNHMNNAVYADIVYDFMPLHAAVDREIDEFRISFKNEAVLGEKVKINSCIYNEGESFGIRGFKESGDMCFEAVVNYRAL